MISKDDINRISARIGLSPMVTDKDYAITWLLKGIYAQPSLKKKLIFKGGTALQKVYFPEIWRYSEDLDFTYLLNTADTLEKAHGASGIAKKVKEGFEAAFKKLKNQSRIEFSFDQYNMSRFESAIQARVQFVGPLQHRNVIKIDISLNETLILKPVTKKLKSNYPDTKGFNVTVYDLREILVEKIRSILQRGRSRDYYDVWRMLKEGDFDLTEIMPLVSKKCELTTDIKFKPELILDANRFKEAEPYWKGSLGRLTKDLPKFEKVRTELKQMIQLTDFLNELKAKKFKKLPSGTMSPNPIERMAPVYPNLIKTAVKTLIEQLDDADPKVVAEAARFLMSLAQESPELKKEAQKAIPKLKKLQKDRDLGVSLEAGLTLEILEE